MFPNRISNWRILILTNFNRFLELSAIVGSGKTSKTDKTAILADAFCTLNQLKAEAQQLKDCNEQLLKTIKKLRVCFVADFFLYQLGVGIQ